MLFAAAGMALAVFCSFGAGHAGRQTHSVIRIADTTAGLPHYYKQRKFLNNVTNLSTNIAMMPGNIVVYSAKDTGYQFRTAHSIIKGGQLPGVMDIDDGALYSGIVSSSTSFNGSQMIGNLSAGKDEVMEITIKDEVVSTVPDSLVDVDAVKSAIKGIPAEELKNLFYVKAATLTSIANRKYTLTKFDNTKNGFYLTLNGKTYSTKEKVKMDRVVSMFLVPLDRLNHQ